jgi:hypothetical protein
VSWKRLLLGFLVAPLVPAVVQTTVGESQYHPGAVFVVAVVILYFLQLVAGIPGYLLFHRTGRRSLQAYALFGFCVGLCVGAALAFSAWLHSRPDVGVLRGLLFSVYFGLLGAATTASFWFVARPDRAARSATTPSN